MNIGRVVQLLDKIARLRARYEDLGHPDLAAVARWQAQAVYLGEQWARSWLPADRRLLDVMLEAFEPVAADPENAEVRRLAELRILAAHDQYMAAMAAAGVSEVR